LREKVPGKLKGWEEKTLLNDGKEVLIKAVAQSLPTYSMFVFNLSVSLCADLNSIISNFWWGQKNGECQIHWISWRKLCESKFWGGLGFQDFQAFNLAMLAKQGWRLINEKDSLCCRVLKAQYFRSGNFPGASQDITVLLYGVVYMKQRSAKEGIKMANWEWYMLMWKST
ncbi:hypothetical protein CFOL_v3_27230, partial [Cephalotus follicularis]